MRGGSSAKFRLANAATGSRGEWRVAVGGCAELTKAKVREGLEKKSALQAVGGKAVGSMLRAVRQTPLTAMLSPLLRRAVSVGAAMVMRVAPSVGVMARSVPVVSIKPVNISTGYRE